MIEISKQDKYLLQIPGIPSLISRNARGSEQTLAW
jgi:hypothetical protein